MQRYAQGSLGLSSCLIFILFLKSFEPEKKSKQASKRNSNNNKEMNQQCYQIAKDSCRVPWVNSSSACEPKMRLGSSVRIPIF